MNELEKLRRGGEARELNLGALLNKAVVKFLLIGFCASLVFHTLVFVQRFEEEGEKVSRPLSMRFIQRAPRLVKPLELKKRPAPKKREMVRKRVVVQAKPMRLTKTVASIGGIPINIGQIYTEEDMGIGVSDIDIGAVIDVDAFRASKEPENVLSMRDEMLSIQDLDTGRYRAMVIQDQADKKNIKGYLHLANINSMAFHVMDHWNASYAARNGGTYYPLALPNLADAMNRYTGIKTKLVDMVLLDSKEIFKLPWILISSRPFELNDVELENLGRYLVEGGFIVGDGGGWVEGEGDISLRKMFKRALARVNRRCEFVRLKGDHPLFHCFFDFDSPPENQGGCSNNNPDYLIGIHVDSRLAGVICYNGIANRWQDSGGVYGHLQDRRDNTRMLQYGVNLIVFALTQRGSITNRLMDTISVK